MAEVTYRCSGGPRVRGYLPLFRWAQSQYPAHQVPYSAHTQIQVKHPYIKYIFKKRRSNLNFRLTGMGKGVGMV